MTTDAETTVSPEESMRITLRAVEDELARAKADLRFWTGYALRLRSRLARVLRAATFAHNFHVTEGGFSMLRKYGCVWSSRALTNKESRRV